MRYEYVPEWRSALIWTIDVGDPGYLELGVEPPMAIAERGEHYDPGKLPVAILPSRGDDPYRPAVGAIVIPIDTPQADLDLLVSRWYRTEDYWFIKRAIQDLEDIKAGALPNDDNHVESGSRPSVEWTEVSHLRRWTDAEWTSMRELVFGV